MRSWVAAWDLDSSPLLQLPRHLYHHTPRSTASMLRTAGFAPREVKPYAVIAQLSAMLEHRRRARGRAALPQAFAVLAPAYRLLCLATRRGDFISACAVKPV